MINKILEIAFSGFWEFIGIWILVTIPFALIRSIWIRLMRMIMVNKHGWPPPHLDADGDWKPKEEQK